MDLGLANKKQSLTGALLGKEVITESLTLGQANKQHPTFQYSTCQASNHVLYGDMTLKHATTYSPTHSY